LFYNIPEALFINEIYDQPQLEQEAEKGESEVLAVIHDSIRKRKVLNFEYDSASGKRKRCVEGRGLIAHRGRWCFVAYCRDARDIRHFYVDRMSEMEMLDQEFKPDKNFHLNQYLLHPLNIRSHEKIGVRIYYLEDYEDAVSDYFSDIPLSLHPKKGNIYFSCDTTNISAIFSWILKNPKIVKNIEPEEVKNQFNDFIRDIRGYYL
jgi:predicted DNA-binding transcriptional regulator YafY